MWIMEQPSSTARRASAAYSSGVYGIAGHWSRLATAPEIEHVMIAGSSKRLIARSAPQHLLRGSLARAHGAVHVAVPERGPLGAGPVDAPDRLAQQRAVLAQHALAGVPDGAAARPRLLRPVHLERVARAAGL